MNCEQVKSLVSNFSLIENCDVIKNGAIRMSVPFQNPDGSKIDLFLKKENGHWILSDLGLTTSNLLDLHVKLWTTKKRKQIVSDICQSLCIQQNGGQFQIIIPDAKMAELPESMVRLAQGCLRISDLAFTQRLRSQSVFREDVEEFLATTDLPYEENIELPGQYGVPIQIDFRVSGSSQTSLLQTLSTANSAAAHGLSTEVFRRWYDLSTYRTKNQFLTFYDTNNDFFRDDDLKRISSVSTIFGYPAEQERITTVLAA
jgi:hypothetical protein